MPFLFHNLRVVRLLRITMTFQMLITRLLRNLSVYRIALLRTYHLLFITATRFLFAIWRRNSLRYKTIRIYGVMRSRISERVRADEQERGARSRRAASTRTHASVRVYVSAFQSRVPLGFFLSPLKPHNRNDWGFKNVLSLIFNWTIVPCKHWVRRSKENSFQFYTLLSFRSGTGFRG